MDYLIDDQPFSGSGKTTFELIDHYLPILIGDLVTTNNNDRLTAFDPGQPG